MVIIKNDKKIRKLKEDVNFINRNIYLKLLLKEIINLKSTSSKLSKKRKEFKKIPKIDKPPVRDTFAIQKIERSLERSIDKGMRLKSEIIRIINVNSYSVKISLNVDLKRFSDLDLESIIYLVDTSNAFKKICQNIIHILKSNEDILLDSERKETKNMFEDLLRTFETFAAVADKPSQAIFNTSSKLLIDKIKQELKKYSHTNKADEDFNSCLENLKNLIIVIDDGRKYIPVLNKEKSKKGGSSPEFDAYISTKLELDKLIRDEAILSEKAKNLFGSLKEAGEIHLSSFDDLVDIERILKSQNNNQLLSDSNSNISNAVSEQRRFKLLNERYKADINQKEKLLANQEDLPKSSYSKNQIALLNLAEKDLTTFIKRISNIKESISEEEIKDGVSMSPVNNYIINSLGGRLPYKNKMNEIIDFDIIQRTVHLKDYIVSFDDLSTGQSSSVYLAHSISNPENKKLLVIIDEIGNMDDQSMSPIIEKLKDHESKGNLVFSLLAKVDNNVNGLKLDYINGVKINKNNQEIIDFI